MKEENKIDEAQIYVGGSEEVPQLKPQLNNDDKLFILGKDEDLTEDAVDVAEDLTMIVKFIKEKNGEPRFRIGDSEWQYVMAKYPSGKVDIGVYRFGHDLVYGYGWFKKNVLDNQNPNEPTKLGETDNSTGSEGGLNDEQKRKIANYIQNYKGEFKDEDIHNFADELRLDKHAVESYIYSLARKNLGESKNPKITKGALLEHINKVKNKK